MNNLPEAIEQKILLEYINDFQHLFVCKSWYNSIFNKIKMMKEQAENIYYVIDKFINKNIGVVFNAIPASTDMTNFNRNLIYYNKTMMIRKFIQERLIHLIMYKKIYNQDWNREEYIKFKKLKNIIKTILNKKSIYNNYKYRIKLHKRTNGYSISSEEDNLHTLYENFEILFWKK